MIKINYYFAQFIILILPSAAIIFESYCQVLGAPAPSISNDSNFAQNSQIQPTFQTNPNEQDTNYKQSYIGIGANLGIMQQQYSVIVQQLVH